MFKFIVRMWYKLTAKKPVTRIIESTEEDKLPQFPTGHKPYTVALICGHTRKKPNAISYNSKFEFFWNKEVQKFVGEKYKGKIKLVFIDRPDYGYKDSMKYLANTCASNNVDLAIELHYDAAGVPTAKGGHFRTLKGDSPSYYRAIGFMNGYLDRFSFASQRHNGCWRMKRGDAGYYFCYYMEKHGIDSMLFEPFFSDYKTDESEPFLKRDGYKLMAHYWIAELDKLEKNLNL